MLSCSEPRNRFLFVHVTDAAAPRFPAVLVPSGWKLMVFGFLRLVWIVQSRRVVSLRSAKLMLVYPKAARLPKLL